MTILTDLNRQDHLTILVVTHDPDIAAVTSRELFLKDGQLIADKVQVPLSQPIS